MHVDVTFTAQEIEAATVAGRNVVVIDALRATSTIITALVNGCQEIIPVREPAEAMKYRDEKGYLLGGERGGLKIPGFDLGNSPLEYTRNVVEGKKVVLCTTNGTLALANSAAARKLIIGAFLNAGAVAQFLAGQGGDVLLACAGTGGKFTLEDFLAAGVILHKLSKIRSNISMGDRAIAAEAVYLQHQDNVEEALYRGHHARDLADLGFSQDVEYCACVDKFELVPVCREMRVVLPYKR